MSKRINQLAVEAGLISAEYNGFDRMNLTSAERKFAELILRDCILSLRTEECDFSDLAVEEFTRNRKRINEHFGVE